MTRAAMQQALEALKDARASGWLDETAWARCSAAIAALRAALAESALDRMAENARELGLNYDATEQKKPMPITDDYGQVLLPQYRVIEQRGQWRLLYDQMVVGEKVRHEFRIVKIPHDILLYPGISLEEAKRRFDEVVENDYE